jgi:hypothetical protein
VLKIPVTVGRELRSEVVVKAGCMTDVDGGRGIKTGADQRTRGIGDFGSKSRGRNTNGDGSSGVNWKNMNVDILCFEPQLYSPNRKHIRLHNESPI